MSFEIIHLGHYEDDKSDKVWGAGVAVQHDGRKTGFRFWGRREGSLTYRICSQDGYIHTLHGMWDEKSAKGYVSVPCNSDSQIEAWLGSKFLGNLNTMRAKVMLVGVSTESQHAGI